MQNILFYCKKFFDELEMYEDKGGEMTYKKDLFKAVNNFLYDESTDKALAVYKMFSHAYWMINDDDSIIRMITEMKEFEQNAGVLTSKQRDHFIHSVNTFLLGISIYISNSKYQSIFNERIQNDSKYLDYYRTKHEEFMYRWGIASLFHDIAYPIEISYNQLKSYLNFISTKCGLIDKCLEASVFIDNTDVFNMLPKMNPKVEFRKEFFEKYPDYKEYGTNAISLMAMEISVSFGIEFTIIYNEMFNYVNRMHYNKCLDHGYYSALIMLRWFYNLVNTKKWNPVYFYFPIVNSATSIILHNYYKHVLMKAPFYLSQLNVRNHPLSYLLIMCDELQDWGRMSYGLDDLKCVYPIDIEIDLDDEKFYLRYKYNENNWNGKAFAEDKFRSIKRTLIIENIFNDFNIK